MYDTGKVLAGLVVFLILVTSPLWFNAASSSTAGAPELKMPTNGSTQCVEATEYMRTSHMDLLNTWREDVVRTGRREYVSTLNGKGYEMSLSRTCMSCHADKAEFCDACHNFTAVSPYCWNCHVEPKEVR